MMSCGLQKDGPPQQAKIKQQKVSPENVKWNWMQQLRNKQAKKIIAADYQTVQTIGPQQIFEPFVGVDQSP